MAEDISYPKLLASTGTKFSCTIDESGGQERNGDCSVDDRKIASHFRDEDGGGTNYFKSMQWSPDGTCVITNSADNIIRTFVAPADLLSARGSSLTLTPYSSLPSPEPVYAVATYPFYSLPDQSTTIFLTSPRDLPIRLSNALYPSLLATYPLVSPTTEAFLTPSSMIWNRDGTNFLTGTDSLIALFDVSRNGSGPVTRLPTIPSKRHKMKGGGVGMRGIVSCLSLQLGQASPTSLLAAGTWTRWIGLYDAGGLGGTVANWSIAAAADSTAKVFGAGITQTLWSTCGRYLFIVERKSMGILVYDVRVTGRLVGWLQGRAAETNQRLGVDAFAESYIDSEGVNETEIWAGGMDGILRVWKWDGVGDEDNVEVGLMPKSQWLAHNSAVSGVAVHPSGTVIATSSGQRQDIGDMNEEGENETSETPDIPKESSLNAGRTGRRPDNSVKIWSI